MGERRHQESLRRGPQLGIALGQVGGHGDGSRREIPAHAVARVLVHGLFGMGPRPPGFLHLHAVVPGMHRAAREVERSDVPVHRELRPRKFGGWCLAELEVAAGSLEFETGEWYLAIETEAA